MGVLNVYLVGGAVRDQLLGFPVTERDYVVVGATPQQMLAKGFRLIGKDFPVFLHPKTYEEYALARTERKVDPGYKGFTCYAGPNVTLEEDLRRRDLTINALAQDDSGKLIDPYHGERDLNNRVLRHISPAFAEDPVRILRVARFMARFAPLGFSIAPETMTLMKTMVASGEIQALVPERVWQEFSLALQAPAPQAFIQTLYQCGALAILFPPLQKAYIEANRLGDKKNKGSIHLLTLLESVAQFTEDAQVRFAVLACYFGQGLSSSVQTTATGVLEIQQLGHLYPIPKTYIELAVMTARYHLLCHRALELDANTLLSLLEKTDAFRRIERFKQFLEACEAEFRAYSTLTIPAYPQKKRLLDALVAAQSVSAQFLIKQGLKKESLRKKLREQRREVIEQLVLSE